MKIHIAKIAGQKVYFFVLAVLLMIITASLCVISMPPVLPECKAVLRSTNEVAGRKIDRVLLISVMPSGWREVTFLLNGRILDGKEKFAVSRAVIMSSEWQGKYVHLQVTENNKAPGDSVKLAELERLLPVLGQNYYVNIEQLDDKSFIFIDNHAPMFVCTLAH
ncbi:hypothetical protein [Serratia entomophila]|uniref:hypothetical protein n=1 Tax=Serratia entomophila TaxID=42906 RepID=UPI00217C2A54|nr:hypothetical protein [Serratia entomophila]CAI0926882.1 Uncharacterised protein [Serratia entomophila]CAI1542185.1 Uncharacterised protein [Serratia entomophila]CAI1663863.1 Uncharacterised protein [Serratia entomophila]CAI1745250.1 Uncharacterised protein [Serratia entomophila]CAI1776202.1 Uncharacterised protein [Serratia entomophila]